MPHLNMLTGGELWHFLQRVEIFPNGEKFYYSPGGERIALTGAGLPPPAAPHGRGTGPRRAALGTQHCVLIASG